MALVFSNGGFIGAAVGRLTSLQADSNIQTLWDAIQAKADQGVGIASVALIGGNQLQFQLTDLSFLPPVTLPTASFQFQGPWLPDTDYLVNDVVTDLGAIYLVLLAHTSAGTFDPNANDGLGNDWYGLMLATPFPVGGARGAALIKASPADYDTQWAARIDLPVFPVAASSSTLALDCANGEFQQITLSANVTSVTIANWAASGQECKLTLSILNTGAFGIAGWPSGTIWAGGSGAPTITSGAGKKDLLVLISFDGGTSTWGNVVGQNYS